MDLAPPAGIAEGVTEPTPIRQLKFDGMPIAQHRVTLSGTVTVSEEAAKAWKLGDSIELTVNGVVSRRSHKAQTNFGEPTGDAEHMVVIHVTDLVLDEL